MKHFFLTLKSVGLLLLLAFSAQAQHIFTSGLLGPYQQNFDAMSTGTVSFTNGTNNTLLPGIVAGYKAGTVFGSSPPAGPNNGSTTNSTPYNFGSSGASDRALGAVTGSLGSGSVTGYVAVRLRNASGKVIRNLDVRYALEQWYNSSISQDAYVRVAYRTYATTTAFNVNDLVQDVNTNGWQAVPTLDLQAPATGGQLGISDGNSSTYRRTAQQRLVGVDLPDNSEVVVRFSYVFNSLTNGNGVGLDDIVIYPETDVLYSKTTGNLDNNAAGASATWGQDTDGNNPLGTTVDFSVPNRTYYIQGSNAASRLSGNWQVTGANSRVIVGTDNVPATLYLAPTDNLTATLEVTQNSTLQLDGTPNGLTLGNLATNSTVEYQRDDASVPQALLPATYATLRCDGLSPKALNGHLLVTNTLALTGSTAPQALRLGSYNLTLQRGAALSRSNGGQIVTDGTGEYRATVIGAGSGSVPVLFPVALSTAAADYLPATITAGTHSGGNDLDETFRVRVADGVYRSYSTAGVGSDPVASTSNLRNTWLISRETATPLAATLKLGWDGGREGSTFARARAFISHYSSTTSWERQQESAGSFADDDQYAVLRSGISSFSPFTVSSNPSGPLPVELTAFAAKRITTAVACSWATASEKNSAYFAVERSLDGVSFREIGTVPAQGFSQTIRSYEFSDQHPMAGPSYYRLRQVDTDGSSAFSAVVAVAGSTAVSITALPNPSDGHLVLHATLKAPAQLHGLVINALGQPVLTINYTLPTGTSSLPLDLSNQPAGLYVAQLQGPQGPLTLRLLKQ
jgi:hypothetical protein